MDTHISPSTGRSLRIAMVTETYPPEINGVAMTIGRAVTALRERGHAVRVFRPRQEQDPRAADPNLLPGLPIPGYAGLRLGLPAAGRLRAAWREQRPDIVHIATEGPLGWAAMNAAQELGIRVVAGFHTNFHSYSRHYGLGWLHRPIHAYLRHFHNRADLTLVPTNALRAQLTAHGYQRVEVVSRGVDTQLYSPAHRDAELRRAWGVGADDLAVLYVGRLAPEKNLPLLIRAYEAMRAVRPTTRLVLVGDGPEGRRLQARHPDLIFRGPRRGAELAAHYASADVFLFPSLTETFGNVILEAMASGLATVAFDYAAAAELMEDGVNGLTATFGQAPAFVARAAALARDAEQLLGLAAAARRTALQRTWGGVFDRQEGCYRRLLAQPSR